MLAFLPAGRFGLLGRAQAAAHRALQRSGARRPGHARPGRADRGNERPYHVGHSAASRRRAGPPQYFADGVWQGGLPARPSPKTWRWSRAVTQLQGRWTDARGHRLRAQHHRRTRRPAGASQPAGRPGVARPGRPAPGLAALARHAGGRDRQRQRVHGAGRCRGHAVAAPRLRRRRACAPPHRPGPRASRGGSGRAAAARHARRVLPARRGRGAARPGSHS